jgi:Undecaprenyl-phosphate galactose phosphotransferase WbaP
LSTHPANEAASSPLITGKARAPHPRPHLVSTGERKRLHAEAAVTATDDASLEATVPGVLAVAEQSFRGSVSARRSAVAGPGAVAKRLVDIVGAVVLGLVFSPLMLAIIVLMRREGGSVIFRHRRIGRGGRTFECLKFRTMIPNADQVLRTLLERDSELKAEWVRDHKLRNDPRITRLGRFLRRTSLDELPQLWNVLRGEMSLVGPRPVVREELLRYGRNVGVYLAAKPGITGLWQVTGRNDTDYRRRVVLDTYYVRNQNLLLDLYILAKTTSVVLGGTGAY